MRYPDAAAFRQALEQRLKARAAGDGARLARDRKRIVFERLVARLVAAAPGRWLLKGGFALQVRLSGRARATRDVDIEWRDDEEELLDRLIEAAGHDAGDFFVFSIERAGLPEDHLGGGHRFRVAVSLGGRPFEAFPLDVGLGRERRPEMLTVPSLLEFAGIGPISAPVISPEAHAAEKLHAYTRTYEGFRHSTRTKDLIDLVLISELSSLDAAVLRGEIEATFADRATHPVPSALPQPPDDWRVPYRRLAQAAGVPGDLAAGHANAAAMIDPVISGDVEQGRWEPGSRRWNAAPGEGRPADDRRSGD